MTKKYWSLTALTLIVVVGLVIAIGGASVAQAVYVGGAHNGLLDGNDHDGYDYNDDGYTQTVETVTPVGACPGETVTVTGTATPGETVTVVIALERVTNWGGGTVPAGDDRYEITLGTAQAGVAGGWSLSAALPTTVVRTSDYTQVDTPAGDWRITVIGLDGYMSDGYVTVLDCGQTPPPAVSNEGRMTGGGKIVADKAGVRADGYEAAATHGFELHCDASNSPNNLEVNWGKGNKFHMESLDSASCSDDPAIDPGSPAVGFDTYKGVGTGRYNGVSGATAEWTFTDAGEPGKNDTAQIVIRDAGGNVVLSAAGNISGNQQAHPDN